MNRKMSTPILHGGSKFRQGVLQLMIHSIDPLHEETINKTISTRPDVEKHRCIHPPGATTCTLCNDENNSQNANGNSIFHTTNMAVRAQNDVDTKPNNGSISAQNTQVCTHMTIQ